jgi:hypothetical protein
MKTKLLLSCSAIFFLLQDVGAQCLLTSAVSDVTLQCAGGTGNRTGVAFNPNQNLYYSVNAGSSGYPIETFTVTGGASLNTTTQGADYRGLWWNSTTNALEGNTYNSVGIYSNSLASITFYATSSVTYISSATMPNIQSMGHADVGNNLMLYYDSGSIYKYNKSNGSFISSLSITGLPSAISNLNSYGIIYTGIPGSEVGVYNYVAKAIYFVNYTSGAYTSSCSLPTSAPGANTFRMGFANSRFFLYDNSTSQWYGYPIFNSASSPTIIASASSTSVCLGNTISITASGANTYTWSTGVTGASVNITPTVSGMLTVYGTNSQGCVGATTLGLVVNPGSIVTSTASTPVICQGVTTTLNASGVVSYTWNTGAQAASTTVSPSSNTNYTVTGTNSFGCFSTSTLAITVNPLPNLSAAINPSVLCVGKTATLVASGATTYTWDATTVSQTMTPSPTITTVYALSGTSPAGCVNSTTVGVNVNTNSLTVSPNSSVCAGSSATLVASGAVSYVWNGTSPFASINVTPAIATTYSVTGVDSHNCTLTNTVSVGVNPLPAVTAGASKTVICKGEPVTLTAGGANTYTWSNPSSTNASLTIIPPVDITYSYVVTGVSVNGCTAVASVVVKVNKCSGINENGSFSSLISVFPNPNNGLFTVNIENAPMSASIKIYNGLGALIQTQENISGNTSIDLQNEANGIYFIRVINYGEPISTTKVIKH